MKAMRTIAMACVGISWLLGACAPPPAELAAARVQVREAAGGELATVASRDVNEARNLLREADACVDRMGDPDVVRDLAYVAQRRIDRARIVARTNAQIEPR